jgi:hypothetical protein
MLDALEFEGTELLMAGYPLEALPILSLYEHVARDAAKSTTHAVEARVLRSTALTQLGLLEESFKQLRSLQLGEGLPKLAPDANLGSSIFTASDDISFSNQLPATHERNLRALQLLSDTTLVIRSTPQFSPPLHLLSSLSSSPFPTFLPSFLSLLLLLLSTLSLTLISTFPQIKTRNS